MARPGMNRAERKAHGWWVARPHPASVPRPNLSFHSEQPGLFVASDDLADHVLLDRIRVLPA